MKQKELFSDLLKNPFTPTSIVGLILGKIYGSYEWLNYDFATILLDLREYTTPLNSLIKEKIKTVVCLLTTDLYYVDWVSFENIAWTLNDKKPLFHVPTPLQGHELVWAVVESDMIDPFVDLPDDEIRYSKEVKRYVHETLIHNGFYETPEELKKYGLGLIGTVNTVKKTQEIKDTQGIKLKDISAYVAVKQEVIDGLAKRINE